MSSKTFLLSGAAAIVVFSSPAFAEVRSDPESYTNRAATRSDMAVTGSGIRCTGRFGVCAGSRSAF